LVVRPEALQLEVHPTGKERPHWQGIRYRAKGILDDFASDANERDSSL